MINILTNRTKNIIYIVLPLAIAIYLFCPLLAGYYAYPIAEYEIYKSFMINFIDSLKKGVLPTWNEYVGCGHPAMYFGHYPISQNTFLYMLFGFTDATYYLTKCLNLIILVFTFIYACKFLKFDYWLSLIGVLVYFSVNFVIRVFVAETIGNLLVVYPLLIILMIKVIQRETVKNVLLFSLVYIFWLSGGHIIYVYMHLIMLSIFFWVTIFIFHGIKAFNFKNITRLILLYVVLFIFPFLAMLYQYYFVYDVIASSNRLKEGLIISPFQTTVWKQLLVSFQSSSYFWIGLFLGIIYIVFKLISFKYKLLKTKRLSFVVVGVLALIVFISLASSEKFLKISRLLGTNYITTVSGTKDNYVLAKESKENFVINGDFSTNTSSWNAHAVNLSNNEGGQEGNCLKVVAAENATGYAYYAASTKPGELYKVSAFYKKGTAANGQIKVGTSIDDTSLYYSGVISNNDWKQYNGSFKATAPLTYITLVNLTSNRGESSYFDTVILQRLELSAFSDYMPIFKSGVFKIALFLFFLINLIILYIRRKKSQISFMSMLNIFCIFVIYVSLLSYYFFSPENIIGDVNGYDFDLFRELSTIYQIIFIFCVLYSMREYHRNKVIKIMVLSLIILYLIRSHFTIPLLRFTGIVWYAPRDGSIFSFFFAVLFMFGLKLVFSDLIQLFRNKGKQIIVPVKYCFLFLLLVLLVWDSYHKFYKGTSHRFIYAKRYPINPMEKWIVEAKKEVTLLNNQLLALDKQEKHFYRTFTPENSYIYLAGDTQKYKIHEAAIYESSYSNDFYQLYNYTILEKPPPKNTDLKDIMPYFLFTKHVHAGLGLQYRDILYSDFFIFNPPKDTAYLKSQNIEFFWDIAQVKYLILGPEFSKALLNFTDYSNYKLLSSFPQLRLNLYEITKDKNYSKLAVYPLNDTENVNDVIKRINAKDISLLKDTYSKLIFLDKKTDDFELLRTTSNDSTRYYEINATKPAILIDFESYNRNWQLMVNNKNKKLNKAFCIFKGVKIEPGLNKIELFYNLKYFKGLFLFSIFVILIYVVLFSRCYYLERVSKKDSTNPIQ